MANVKLGSHPSHGESVVEQIDTTGKQLTRSDSGKIFMCIQNSTADVVCYLPQLSTDMAGWNAKFVIKTASSKDFAIVAYGSLHGGATTGDSDTIVYHELTDSNTTVADADAIEFTESAADVGSFCDIFTDGSKWYAYVRSSADANVVSAG
tara:strand:+ start:542 stop:994 length:453 start_codon:yes stop_codon:yes gene_type:complete